MDQRWLSDVVIWTISFATYIQFPLSIVSHQSYQ